ncbi:MAG: 3-hydroxybutyrate dehydrogenase [Bernardetiaceae bacterium]|nr:3-hydroxybutyrate dehydrogenase [Bernardetiaceae bacterium]
MSSENKTALITGSTRGIGCGIAEAFAKAGYNVVVNGLEDDGPQIAEGFAEKYGVKAHFTSANMLNPEEIRQMISEAEEVFGSVDVLINNAGVQYVSPLEDFPEARWDMIIGINLTSVFHTTKAVWKGMKERGFGRIINIASAHGLRASAYKSAYVAAKHGIVGLTKVLALEGAAHNITANAICPGYVRTPLVEAQIADQAKAHGISEEEVIEKIMLQKQAVKEFVPIELLAGMALMLASDKATAFTGTALPIEGGWTAQ